MPKQKSHSGAGKRFRVNKNGLIKRSKQGKNHKRAPQDIDTNPIITGHECSGVIVEVGKKWQDKYKVGVDATDGSRAVNYGNYGVLYKLAIPVKENAPRVQYYLTPLGGTYAGAMTVRRDHSPYTKKIETPAGRVFFGDQTEPEPESVSKAREDGIAIFGSHMELADLGNYDNSVPTYFEFSPPGASNLPACLILMPAE